MTESLWKTSNLYGRRWENTTDDALFLQKLVADWPGVDPRQLYEVQDLVRSYSSGSSVALPLSASTRTHWRCEVYMLRGRDGAADIPIGGLWGKVTGTVWTHIGQAILPNHRGHAYSVEAGRASVDLFFSAAVGGTEILTETVTSRTSARVRRISSNSPTKIGERPGRTGTIHIHRITPAQRFPHQPKGDSGSE